jgi:16S rRNA (guanine527-N7)-methyltransferase
VNPKPPRRFRNHDVLLSSKYIREAVNASRASLQAAGIEPMPALLEAMATYIDLLLRWNRKLNLTAITDPQDIVTRNFLESFLAVRWLPAEEGRLCDVGSGAGFPGLALKLVRPRWQMLLMEPSRKKSVFLAEVTRSLGLQAVEVRSCRWEDSQIAENKLDVVTSRALGRYRELAGWAHGRLPPGGRLILWVGAKDAADLSKLIGWQWEQKPVPGSRERVLLVGSPTERRLPAPKG